VHPQFLLGFPKAMAGTFQGEGDLGSVEVEVRAWASSDAPIVTSTPAVVSSAHSYQDSLARSIDAEVLARSIETDVKQFVARELHDQVVQTLTTMLLDMERFKREQFGRVSVQDEVSVLQRSVRDALNQIRTVVHDLRDQQVVETEFVESISQGLIAVFEQRTGIAVTLSVSPSWPAALPSRAALNLYRAIQEALNNVMRHAYAQNVRIGLEVGSEGHVIVTVEDDGQGLVEDKQHPSSVGLVGMRERAVLLGGHLSVGSRAGEGTTVRLIVPLEGLL
jgi:signal transduction histidine kinase